MHNQTPEFTSRLAPRPARPRWARYAGYCTAWILIIAVGRAVTPASSHAAFRSVGPGTAGFDPHAALHLDTLPGTDGSKFTSSASGAGTTSISTLETPPTTSGMVLGTIVGPEYTVTIRSSAQGPRYTVTSRGGAVLATGLGAAQLAQRFPSLDPANLNANPDASSTTPLMDASTDH